MRHSSLPVSGVYDTACCRPITIKLGAAIVLPDERRRPARRHALRAGKSRSTRHSCLPVRASIAAANDLPSLSCTTNTLPVVDHRRRRGAEVEIHRLRIEPRVPQRLAVERVGEQPDVAEIGVEPLAVGGRRFRREGVLAMTAAERHALVRFALPLQLAGARRRRRRPCSGSRRSRWSARCRARSRA